MGYKITERTVSHAVSTAQHRAVMDVMMVFFDDATIDSIEKDARKKYRADPYLFVEN